MKKLNILMGNNTLSLLAGTETWTYTLAVELKRKGHGVSVYSNDLGIAASKLEQAEVPCLATLDRNGAARNRDGTVFDILIANHHDTITYLHNVFPELPIIATCHGITHYLSDGQRTPEHPIIDFKVAHHVVVSEELQILLKQVYYLDSILVRNFVDTRRFCYCKPRSAIRKILFNSNYSGTDSEVFSVVQEVARYFNAELLTLGQNFERTWEVEKWLAEVDVVFSMGRGILEAMAMGKVAVCHGRWGTGGIVHAGNVKKLRQRNFSGRHAQGKLESARKIAAEIDRFFNEPHLNEMRKYVESNHNVETAARTYLDLANEFLPSNTNGEKGSCGRTGAYANVVNEPIEALYTRGSTLVADGDLKGGLQFLSRVLELQPRHFETLMLMGGLYERLGKRKEARRLWELALSAHPDDLTVLKRLGKPVDCSIVIPVFNQLQFTRQCLKRIRMNTPQDCYEIVVVDNHSTDGTKEYLQGLNDVRVISNDANLGFAIACNQGAKAALHEFLLFLNNDVEVQSGWLEPLISTLLNDPDVAVAGSKLLYPDGKIQHAGVITVDDREYGHPVNPWHVYYRLDGTLPQANIPREYSAVTGACLLTRKSLFERLGGFDQAFRNGYEDVDYCYKVGACGYKIVYRPESVAIHHESKSGTERFAYEDTNFQLLVSRWRGKAPIDIRRFGVGRKEFLRPFKTYLGPKKKQWSVHLQAGQAK
ncbi:MAG: glycosyltransferase [bacterium]